MLPAEARLLRGGDGELDVELVDRFGHDGLSYTPDPVEAERRVREGEADCAFLIPLGADRRRLRARAARRADAAEDDVLLPEARLRAAFPPGRPVTDWLAFCRACVADLEVALAGLPTRAEREPVLRAGEGGDDTTAVDDAAEEPSSRGSRRSAPT